MFDNILVVCVGNICRSPTGERILQNLLPNKRVASAGLIVERSCLVGEPADPMAVEVGGENGTDITNHQSQQLTPALCQHYDLILVMEKHHLKILAKIAPEAMGKTMLFGKWLGDMEIPDPYHQSKEAFEHVYQLISKAAEIWAKKL